MKRIGLAAILLVVVWFLPSSAQAQCNGVFGANTVCGSVAGGPPSPVALGTIGGVTGSGVVGNIPVWTGASMLGDSGSALAPSSPLVHQNGGGTNTGATLMRSNQNNDLQIDHLAINSQDQSQLTFLTIAGTPAAGNTVTATFTLASSAFPVVYTVQAGDTTTTIATALAACINGGSTHCTGGAAFVAADLAFTGNDGIGYEPNASAAGSIITMDFPWATSGNSVAASATGGGATITKSGDTLLDNGPLNKCGRNVPGRAPAAGDQLCNYQEAGQSAANTGFDSTAFAMPSYYMGGSSGAGYWRKALGTAAGVTNALPVIWVGPQGFHGSKADGSGNSCGSFAADPNDNSDPGFGNWAICDFLYIGVETPTTQTNIDSAGVWPQTTNQISLGKTGQRFAGIFGVNGSLSGVAAHSILQGEGTSNIGGIAAATAGNIIIDQGAGFDWLSGTLQKDCTLASNGSITCTKTNNVAFAASATTDTTNASNISSGTLSNARLPNTWTSYSPSISCGTGTITTLGTVSGAYYDAGPLRYVELVINITTNGTCAGTIVATLPSNPINGNWVMTGRETLVSGSILSGSLLSSGSVIIQNYANTYPGGTGTKLIMDGWYRTN